MLKRSVLFTTIVVAMTVVLQPVEAQTPASKSVNQTQAEIQQLRSEVFDLKIENGELRSDVNTLKSQNKLLLDFNDRLRSDVNSIRYDLADKVSIVGLAFLIGSVCAFWAQYTRRNPWLWFFLGFWFTLITLLFVLSKNSEDLNANRQL